MATVTAQTIINGALRILGAINSGDNPTSSETADGLEALNQLLLSWSGDGLTIPTETEEGFSTVAAQSSYTIGSGGNFNTVRPLDIHTAYAHDTVSGVDFPIGIESQEWYDSIALKTLSTIPEHLFYQPNYPLGIIYLFPVPDKIYTLNLTSLKPLTELASAGTTVSMAEHYQRALKWNLVLEIAPEYGVEVSAIVQRNAMDALRIVKTLGAAPTTLVTSDAFFLGGRNIGPSGLRAVVTGQ